MAEEIHKQEAGEGLRKRKSGNKKGKKTKKKPRVFQGSGPKVKIDKKMQKLFRKRARDYNSDDDGDDEDINGEAAPEVIITKERPIPKNETYGAHYSEEEEEDQEDGDDEIEVSEDEDGQIQPGIAKFTEGNKAFRMAFVKITKTACDDVLGPVLSAHKKLVGEKLAEEEVEKKAKGEAKKEKHLIREKGHVKPANFLDSHEKLLIGVATKGVVKLFNAVNKAQQAQKGLNPDRSKDAKVIQKRKKEAFFSELAKPPSASSSDPKERESPAWAPLRDGYMLTSSKLKNWDKLPEKAAEDDEMGVESSSDDD